MTKHARTPVVKAIEKAGGAKKIAQALEISHQAVSKWPYRLPAERVLDLERLCDRAVTRHELRPDLYPRDHETA